MRHYFFAFVFFLSSHIVFAQVPTISSFAPAAGPTGSNVVITGTNFNTTAANNTVYFGTVKATVSAASANSITAIVPVCANFQPISVTVNNLTAFSNKPFITSFGTGTTFTNDCFASPVEIAAARTPCFGDFDNDGIIDMAAIIEGNKISLFRNQSTPGDFSFSVGQEYTAISVPTQIVTSDFDGDGKLDLAVIGSGSAHVALYRNISTPGNIVFDNYVDYTAYSDCYSIDVNDIDGDGKPDLVIGYISSGKAFSVGRNTSTLGNISFALRVNFNFGTVPGGAGNVGNSAKVFASDVDGDGKPDVTCLTLYFPPFLIYRNTSVPGTISFAEKVAVPSGRTAITGLCDYKLADIDGDNKLDIAVTIFDSSQICILRNTSTIGNISYSAGIKLNSGYSQTGIAISNMDGDARPDILVIANQAMIIIKNNSAPGNIITSPGLTYPITVGGAPLLVADVDADGKEDIVLTSTLKVWVFRNMVYGPVINSILPVTAMAGEAVTIKGARFTGAGAVSFGGVTAASFTVLSDSVIIAVVGNGASGDVTVVSPGGEVKFGGFTFSPPIPFIFSFAPTAGPVGSTIVIKGKNFSSIANENIVYFGAGKATVIAATDTTLKVTAPTGTSYLPISVTVNTTHLTAFSHIPFNTTFDSHIAVFSNANFGDTVNYVTPSNPVKTATADFDNDGKPDIAASIYFDWAGVSVYKNVSSNGKPAFAMRRDYETFDAVPGGNSTGVTRTVTCDVDGDGKPDMATISNGADLLSVFRNTSNTDSISFEPKINFAAGDNPTNLSAADLDNDGKPDMVATVAYPGSLSVLKNISEPGTVSFAPKIEVLAGSVPEQVLLEDFDNDGKKDMACTNFNENNMALFRNISTTGTISFAARIIKSTNTRPIYMAAADLDGDGKIDILVSNNTPKTISVFQNISTPGNLLFADKVDFDMTEYVAGITIADLDGDGKPDVIAGNGSFPANISLFKNRSTTGNIQFAERVDISKTNTPNNIFTTDVNNDGKPDIIVNGNTINRISILRNFIGDPVTVSFCASADSTFLQADLTGSAYKWQVNTGNGFADINDGINYRNTDSSRLVLKNIPSSWYGYQYRCVVDGINSTIQVLKVQSRWLGTFNTAWENPGNWSCGNVPDSNTDVVINNGTIVVNSAVIIRSIKIKQPVTLTINTGFDFKVLQ